MEISDVFILIVLQTYNITLKQLFLLKHMQQYSIQVPAALLMLNIVISIKPACDIPENANIFF
jgi:hypothetical protein